MRLAIYCVAAIVLFVALGPATIGAVVPPRDGGEMPQWYYDRLKEDPNAFQFQNAWIQKTRRAREARESYIAERGFYQRQLVSSAMGPQLAVSGNFNIPVFCSKFANTGADPHPIADLQKKLYDGPDPNQTLTEVYTEMSYGDLTLAGTVYGWTTLANIDTYYEGPSGCNALCASAHLDEYVTETLNANDGAVDFGQYDNDGPDGLPNSGDDDGFVDVVAFVHAEFGAECGGVPYNIWSHRWNLNGLLGAPYTTNDARVGAPGFIKLNDYVIQPIFNCDGSSLIDIGVFAHEYGHAFGLPDLYDTVSPYSAGIGHWGLMASGSWNTTDFPAHMSAWSKNELGWVNLIEVGSKKSPYSLLNVEQNRPVYRLDVMHERWRRMTPCAINGSYSMRCGLLAAEGTARNWVSGDGYGDEWIESMSREFTYNGSDPVTLTYQYSFDSEATYDFTHLRVEVNGTKSTVVSYDGSGSGGEVVNLTPYLTGSGASTYTVSFEFESDVAWSDEDGSNATTCGPFVVDDISLSGGGESYSTDFETREDGWVCNMESPAEYFLVENRQPIGSDQGLWGGGGLVIYHINDDVARARVNTGGTSGSLLTGIYVEQADGLAHLDANTNRGDSGDPFPGSTANMLFDNATTPSSKSDDGTATNVCVELTSANPANGDPMTANMAGGWPLPTYASVLPTIATNNAPVVIDVEGAGFVSGASVTLTQGATLLVSSSVEWVGKDLMRATVDITGAPGGYYDLTVTNPGEGCVVADTVFEITNVLVGAPPPPRAFRLGQNYPNPFNPSTIIPFDLNIAGPTTLKLYNVAGQLVRILVDESLEARSYSIQWNGRTDSGARAPSGIYFYKLVSGRREDVRKLVLMK